jgi:hypothetical protein
MQRHHESESLPTCRLALRFAHATKQPGLQFTAQIRNSEEIGKHCMIVCQRHQLHQAQPLTGSVDVSKVRYGAHMAATTCRNSSRLQMASTATNGKVPLKGCVTRWCTRVCAQQCKRFIEGMTALFKRRFARQDGPDSAAWAVALGPEVPVSILSKLAHRPSQVATCSIQRPSSASCCRHLYCCDLHCCMYCCW